MTLKPDETTERPPVLDLGDLLRSLVNRTQGETVSVRDLLGAVGRRAYGPILALLGFVALSPLTIVPGASSLVALLTLLIAGQLAFGLSHPWVPKKLLDLSFPRDALVRGVAGARKWIAPLDALLNPRLTFLTAPPFVMVVAVTCMAAAVVTVPLSFVPLGPVVPSLAVLLFGIGITARDGVFILLAGAALTGAVLVLMRLWHLLPF